MAVSASKPSGTSTTSVVVSTPSASVFPLSGFSSLRTVQDARRYLGATRVLLAQVYNAPSGVPYEVKLPLGDAWFQVNVGLSLCDSYIRMGRTWYDSIDRVDGLRQALQGLLRAFAYTRPSWERWDKERKVTAGGLTGESSKAASTAAAGAAATAAVTASASASAASASDKSLAGWLNDLTMKPTTTTTYIGIGIVTLGAWLLWSARKK